MNRQQQIFQAFYRYSRQLSYIHSVSNVPLVYRTVGEQLKLTTHKYPDNLAVASLQQNQEFTYSQFYEKCKQLATAFISLGLNKQDRIGIYSPNNYEWALTQFAASMADLILVNINPAYQITELEYALNKAGCKALITATKFKSSNYIEMLKTLAPEISTQSILQHHLKRLPTIKTLIKIDEGKENGFLNFSDLFYIYENKHIEQYQDRSIKIDPNEITNIQFTSGTTGSPKGASLTHFNVVNNGLFIGERLRYTQNDRVCIPVPLYHCFGMVLGNMTCINYGSAMVYPSEQFSAKTALNAVTKYQCTSLYGVPTMFIEYLNEYQKSSQEYKIDTLRTGIIAGSLAPEKLLREIIEILQMKDITNCYGMTETSPVSTQTKIEDTILHKTQTVGSALPHVEIKIIDEHGKVVPRGTPGEFCARGYLVMKKYWNDPGQTKEAIDDSGFIRSGDLAIMDEEGYVSICGRKKDMIIRGGENISPKEVEDFLLQIPGVETVQVVGCKDEKLGEEVAAIIKMKEGQNPLPRQLIFEFCHKKIAHFKIPKYVKYVDEFPITVTGKPQKFKMRDQINAELQHHDLQREYQLR